MQVRPESLTLGISLRNKGKTQHHYCCGTTLLLFLHTILSSQCTVCLRTIWFLNTSLHSPAPSISPRLSDPFSERVCGHPSRSCHLPYLPSCGLPIPCLRPCLRLMVGIDADLATATDLDLAIDLAIDPPLLTVDRGSVPWRPPTDLATHCDPAMALNPGSRSWPSIWLPISISTRSCNSCPRPIQIECQRTWYFLTPSLHPLLGTGQPRQRFR
jgi:hypothetical protein